MSATPQRQRVDVTEATRETVKVVVDIRAETDAMRTAVVALEALDPDARGRAMRWLDSRLGTGLVQSHREETRG